MSNQLKEYLLIEFWLPVFDDDKKSKTKFMRGQIVFWYNYTQDTNNSIVHLLADSNQSVCDIL